MVDRTAGHPTARAEEFEETDPAELGDRPSAAAADPPSPVPAQDQRVQIVDAG
jgi:hypothetical protein